MKQTSVKVSRSTRWRWRNPELARERNRIYKARQKAKGRSDRNREPWSQAELNDLFSLSCVEFSAKWGRSIAAVDNMRARIRNPNRYQKHRKLLSVTKDAPNQGSYCAEEIVDLFQLSSRQFAAKWRRSIYSYYGARRRYKYRGPKI